MRGQRLAECWRRWGQAAEAADQAEEAEAFQAVGARCRELLLALIRKLARDWMVPAGEEQPKAADFVHWTERVAEGLAEGASAERLRGYLKTQAKATWEMIQWLTHAKNATRFDAELALEAARATLDAFGTALLRYERAYPDRCRRCSSYRVVPYEPHPAEEDPTLVRRCESCGELANAVDHKPYGLSAPYERRRAARTRRTPLGRSLQPGQIRHKRDTNDVRCLLQASLLR